MATLPRIKIRPRTRLAILASAVLTLSVAHHLMNFWGLSVVKMALVLFCIPILSIALDFLLSFLSALPTRIDWKNWGLFLALALPVSGFLAWRAFELPVVWHHLEIIPAHSALHDPVTLVEIKESSGVNAKFSRISHLGTWALREEMLLSDPANPAPLYYTFEGPVYKPVTLTFRTSPRGGNVHVVVDAQTVTLNLTDEESGYRNVQLNARYRFGIPGMVMASLTFFLDLTAFLLVFMFFWRIQDSQQASTHRAAPQGFSHWKEISLLTGLGLFLHLINFLSVPLLLDADSPSYIQGAVHWSQHRDLNGVSPIRGPGTTILFIPIVSLFGRNPWGLKALLHLLALACIPLTYWLGWQLSGSKRFACGAGLLAVFTPDLYFYSNFLMSEVPNIFFTLLFSALLLSAMKNLLCKTMVITLLIGSFLVLLRPENLIAFAIGGIFLLIRIIWGRLFEVQVSINKRSTFYRLACLGVAGLLAAAPIVGWALHNQRLHGFFGLSNYGGEVFYTGWIYQAEASNIPITDPNSPAVSIIKKAYWEQPDRPEDVVPTGWEIHPYLIRQGYGDEAAFAILRQAALESITKDYRVTLEVLAVKLRDCFIPATTATLTMPLPGDPAPASGVTAQYYDNVEAPFPALVFLQRGIYALLEYHYRYLYPTWVLFCLSAAMFALYRRPSHLWLPIALIALTRVFVPSLIGFSHWRPTVSGIILLQILGLAGLQMVWGFLAKIMQKPK